MLRVALATVATCLLGAAPAAADAGKVLVFTGTAGTTNGATAPAAAAIQSLATANGFSVDVTNAATAFTPEGLAQYRAVTFVHSAGDVLNVDQQEALRTYVEGGGGFVGIGETAKLEEGEAFFDTLIGLTGAERTAGVDTTSQDVEFLDRVHPATRGNALVWEDHTDAYYKWTANPTGKVHTVARVRFGALPDGTSVTNDAVTRFAGGENRIQPQQERAVSWCRDVGQGRSFYTALGGTAAAYQQNAVTRQLLGAIQWAAGMSRGNCKATIDANYTATRVTPPNPAGLTSYTGEIDALAMAKDGRVFYAGRASCFAGMPQVVDWQAADVGKGCGTIHVFDPNVAGSDDQNPAKIAKVAELTVFGARGEGSEHGVLGLAVDPEFTTGRPYLYVQYHPYYKGEGGAATNDPAKQLGPGLDRKALMGERRVSRFTYDPATKAIVPGSEKVIFHWMTQVYSCCRVGGSMDFDSDGNLYIGTGDTISGAANAYRGGYTNDHPNYTVPVDGQPRANHDETPGGGELSFADARQTAANTNAYEGKLLRIKPLASPGSVPGNGTTYTIPGEDAPNGPNLFAPTSDAVKNRLAKPEVFAMGISDLRSLDIDTETDKISAAWSGTEQQANSVVWGPAKTETAAKITGAGNYGWPYCAAGNRFSYRSTLGAIGGGGAANLGRVDTPRGTIAGGENEGQGAFWDCSKALPNDSRFNTGLSDIPAPKAANVWYGPQGGCYDFARQANGVPVYNDTNTSIGADTARHCPWALGGGQSIVTGGTYRRPAQAKAGAWPAYWEGRWFLADFAGSGNVRHALLMDPETEDEGGQPVSADSLYGIIPASLLGAHRLIDLDFGADGALYVAAASGSRLGLGSQTGVWRFSYTGGTDTPGPDPVCAVRPNSSTVDCNVGRSGGVSYEWTFSDGGTATGTNVSYAFRRDGTQQATLTVVYADGERVNKTIDVEIPPLPSDEEDIDIIAEVPLTLGLTLGTPATFEPMIPGVAATYTATTTAKVLSTAGDAALSIVDRSTVSPGHLVNGPAVMPQALRARATTPERPDGAYRAISGTPLNVFSWTGPVANETVTLGFQQPVATTDALRGGKYAKTLTFTLSTTTP
ncbi:ThuA domain-containing protein [Solirubrobacter deserti]|uniref:ThuA domain-containing protein n=1 Tax=Solirubrobacter deserti TaxID=2282478 RepID=A0ABT4RDD6_9ACTN|nr:ThuA domain-containing protein [Solirubrobacter deserti]MDA0136548.1 ThuA domain-containing protein [Solirubrobacter deserti]